MERQYPDDTIAAIATPPGRGGIGIVRISGLELGLFFSSILRLIPQPRYAYFGDFYGARGEVIDNGIALRFAAPNSFTGEDILELQGHGGPAVMRLLLNRCLDLGARLAEPGEFSKRAFLNGKIDLAQAESVADLIEAATSTAASAAMRSLRGEFSARVRSLVSSLVELRAFTEATLDFPDEEVELLQEGNLRARLAGLGEAVSRILHDARRGQLLRDGLHLVLIGQPNVGKSSLLNRLAGDEIAIVTPVAGTTRDAIKHAIEIAGVPLHLVDSAGLRDTADTVERLGIERTWRAIEEADLAVLIVDALRGVTQEDRTILGQVSSTLRRVVVHNKIDLSGDRARREVENGVSHVYVSAKTGEGIERLQEALLEAVGWGVDEGETSFIARERHVRALEAAGDHVRRAEAHGMSIPMAVELIAEELRGAQHALSSITGEFTPDDLLGEIFSRFCIGK